MIRFVQLTMAQSEKEIALPVDRISGIEKSNINIDGAEVECSQVYVTKHHREWIKVSEPIWMIVTEINRKW